MHMGGKCADIAVVAAVNDRDVLRNNLAASPSIRSGEVKLVEQQGFGSAGAAYNAGLDACQSPLVVFAHQDVYLPGGWMDRLTAARQWLDRADPKWAVLGVYGMGRNGALAGRAWCTARNRVFGRVITQPVAAAAYDEIVIILRRDSGLRFDEKLPGYHLYGTDIVQQCWCAGRSAYIFDGPVVHNSKYSKYLPHAYWDAYRYMQRKWAAQLPIRTAVAPLTRRGWPYYAVRRWLLSTKRLISGECGTMQRHPDPAKLAQVLGFDEADLAQVP